MRLKLLAGTALTLAGAAGANTALADTTLGWYVAADAGQTRMSTQTLQVSDVTLQGTASSGSVAPLNESGDYSLKTDHGAAGFVRAGYQFTRNLRAEVEYGARPGTVIEGVAGERTPNLGTADKSSLMANLIYDILPNSKLHPFVGVGAGVLQVKTDYLGASSNNGHTQTYSIKQDKTVPAGQFLAGASWYVTDRLTFDMTYRYLRTGETSYDVTATDTFLQTTSGGQNETQAKTRPFGPLADTTATITDTYAGKASGHFSDHSLTVGLRWTFGTPTRRPARTSASQAATQAPAAATPVVMAVPAAPATSPVPPPVVTAPLPVSAPIEAVADSSAEATASRQFAVYFPFDNARLNGAAKEVVAEAARYALSAPEPKVDVVGHTDTSGSAAYNLILSQRRARAVASSLKDEGVAESAISVRWMGEKDLAVPTRNGVSRPENRRTTIDVSF